MSKVKKILSVIMAMVMVLAMSVPTFAGTVTPSKITRKQLWMQRLLLPEYMQIIQNQAMSTATSGWTFTNGALADASQKQLDLADSVD